MIVELKNVSKILGKQEVLHNINLTVGKGETFVLLGPNGAGKTTSIRLMTGLLQPTSGSVKLFNYDMSADKADHIRERIGVQNDGNLYNNLSVYDNLYYWGKLYNMNNGAINNSITNLLRFFKLTQRKNSKVGELSKGMRQKVSLARALLHEPELLILDEPVSGLDPEAVEDFLHYLKKLVKEKNISIIMSTHQLFGLENLADNVGIINNGNIVATGPVYDLIQNQWQEVLLNLETDQDVITLLTEFGKYTVTGKNSYQIKVKDKKIIAAINTKLVKNGINVFRLEEKQHTIRDLYFELVGEPDEL